MAGGIEGRAHRGEGLDPVATQGLLEHPPRGRDPLGQGSLDLSMGQGTVEVVNDRQEVLEELLDAIALDVFLLTRGALLEILEIGGGPEVALVGLLEAVEGLARPLDREVQLGPYFL